MKKSGVTDSPEIINCYILVQTRTCSFASLTHVTLLKLVINKMLINLQTKQELVRNVTFRHGHLDMGDGCQWVSQKKLWVTFYEF